MEDLKSREEILKITGIRENQMKAYRRLNLIDGHVKKKSIVKVDEKKTKEKSKKFFKPAGFVYLYPNKVIQQIIWIVKKQEQGKNLREIQDEYIRMRIQREEDAKSMAKNYEKWIEMPTGSDTKSIFGKKRINEAIEEMIEIVKTDNPGCEIKRLVFLIKPEDERYSAGFQKRIKINVDVEHSLF